jgi:hypothetical protein
MEKYTWKACKHWAGMAFDGAVTCSKRTNQRSIRVLLPGQEAVLKTSVFKVFSKRSF